MKKVWIWLLALTTLAFTACRNNESKDTLSPAEKKLMAADSVARHAIYSFDRSFYRQADPKRANFIVDSLKNYVDSLENCGDLTELVADELRGELYMYTLRDGYEPYFNKIMAQEAPTDIQQWHYKTAGNYLAYQLYMRHNYEGFLRVAVPLIAWMDSLDNDNWKKKMSQLPPSYENGTYSTWAQRMNLYSLLGCCYLKLEQREKAKEVFQQFDTYSKGVLAEDSSRISPLFVNTYARVKDAYVRVKDWEEVVKWLDILDTLGTLYGQKEPESDILKIYNVYGHLDDALDLWIKGDTDSAAVEYDKFIKDASNDLNAIIQANDEYLMPAKRYAEAAEHYDYLDYFVNKPWLEEISAYYFPKLRANYYAGRKDTALRVAMQIADLFDSAYFWQKKSQMAEMATIYDTQGKEMEIARQQAKLSKQRLVGAIVALLLLSAFFLIYSWYRRRAQKRLATAHSQLQEAYDKLEETTAAKERIESELRIARDIQMSMVPSLFPEYEGLDMFAAMIPAKEVGGDLYGYVLQGDRLYFCVGDVSGKGVPASLFMAQSARLFRTLASEGMVPADIAVRMNNALAENNETGMFVTMFIGLLDLKTGHLDYCNCGHNAPVIDGQFMKLEYANQPLGLWEDDPFYGESLDDIRGKQILVYTDGLNEAENPQQELLGNDRLLELMSDTQSITSRQVIEKLMNAVEEHRAGADPNDDLTLMCLSIHNA
jgi:serine phosphatase RsbU (regulator of sigma subunit)